MKTKILLIALVLWTYAQQTSLAQRKNPQDILQQLQNAKEDTNKVNLLIELIYAYNDAKPDTDMILFEQALQLAKKLNDKNKIAFVYERLFVFENNRQRFVQAFKYQLDALKIYEEINDKKGIAKSYSRIANYYSSQNDTIRYLEYVNKALQILEETNDKSGISSIYQNLGNFHYPKNKNLGMEYLQKSLKLREETKNINAINTILQNIASIHRHEGNFEEALKFHFKILENLKDRPEGQKFPVIYSIANTYRLAKNYPKALEYVDLALKNEARESMVEYLYLNKADIYFNMKQYKEAEKNALNALKEITLPQKKNVPKKGLKDIHDMLYQIYERQGNYQQAFKYLQISTRYQDSINQETNQAEVRKLQFDLEMDRKQKEVSLLEKDKLLEQQEKERQQLFNLMLAISLILTLVIAFVVYRNRQAKNRQDLAQKEFEKKLISQEEALKLKYEKERIAKDLHDNIGSQLTYLVRNLENMKGEEKDKTINLSEMAQNIIKELRNAIWVINQEEISIRELESKIANLLYQTVGQIEGIDYELKADIQQEIILNPTQALNLFRIVQEGLQNAIKYSEAKYIQVKVQVNEFGTVYLSINDDGVGFDKEKTLTQDHYGLQNMQRRAEEIGGTFQIETKIGAGTKVEVRL
jgi:signal transduction histidine kinase